MSKKLKYYIVIILPLAYCIILSCTEEAPTNLVLRPIANAGPDQLVEIFDTVYLDGSLSNNSEDAEYIWSFNYKPAGSTVTFSDSSDSNPFIVTDVVGYYSAQLVIRDGDNYSESDYVVFEVKFQKSVRYFPNTVGNEWHYEVTNENGWVADTLVIKIVDSIVFPDGTNATVWVLDGFTRIAYYDRLDTLYVSQIADTVFCSQFWSANMYSFESFVVPFVVGNVWGFVYPHRVLQKEPISIGFGTFDLGYIISSERGCCHVYAGAVYSIVPNVGIVKAKLSENDWGTFTDETWELIYYNIAE